MPISFYYNREQGILYGLMEGILTLAEYKEAMEELTNSEDFSPGCGRLWDMRTVDFNQIDRDFENHVIEILRALPERGRPKVACVVEGELGFGMGRMFETLAEQLPQKIRIFKDYDVANSWVLDGANQT